MTKDKINKPRQDKIRQDQDQELDQDHDKENNGKRKIIFITNRFFSVMKWKTYFFPHIESHHRFVMRFTIVSIGDKIEVLFASYPSHSFRPFHSSSLRYIYATHSCHFVLLKMIGLKLEVEGGGVRVGLVRVRGSWWRGWEEGESEGERVIY